MDPLEFLDWLKSSRKYRGRIVHIERIPAREALYADLDPPIQGLLREALQRQGIERFYAHQVEAISRVRRGEHVIVVTSTASGKTLCYNVPVLEALERNPRTRALYIYPTKALAQDQLGKLRQYDLSYARTAAYDGDTPKRDRPFIKSTSNIVLTNPDMLHVGILPYHTTWSDFFRNLKYVVIDEVHGYRGVFGAHVANIVRRLRRVAQYYGAAPQFICASATVREPGELFNRLTGLDAHVVENDGSPSGEKLFVFWNPPFIKGKDERRSSNSEAVELFTKLIESGIRTIVFAKSRKAAELILRYAKKKLREQGSAYADRIMSYRAGYRPVERRAIEQGLFTGELVGVASTTALEVGVDIGGLDAVVITGYPGSISSTWQQAGRAGRGASRSFAALIAQDDPIDQYLMREPSYFFRAEHERTIIDPQNPYILADHLVCAAYEIPLENSEALDLFGERSLEVLGSLGEVGQLEYRRRWYWTGSSFPAATVNIRSASSDSFDIVALEKGGVLLGTVDTARAFETVHPGAIYLHAGESYIVTRLDLNERVAYVERTEVNYYTTPGSRTTVRIDEEVESRYPFSPVALDGPADESDVKAAFGRVTISNKVTHFWRKQLFTERAIDRVPLDLPETVLATEAAWLVLPRRLVERLVGRGFDLAGTIHAVEHVTIGILPLFAICDRSDVGGVSHPEHPDTDGLPSIFIYDGYPGGVGLARAAYERLRQVLEAALKTVEDCVCTDGCPACVHSPKCGNNNQPLDKAGATFLLREVLRCSD
ncbi:MAG: DEAD/DEAH box helicase [Armatimonadota bacterium]|nr:DEAD/DEAH box helicase [Armatimonadota bacterium]